MYIYQTKAIIVSVALLGVIGACSKPSGDSRDTKSAPASTQDSKGSDETLSLIKSISSKLLEGGISKEDVSLIEQKVANEVMIKSQLNLATDTEKERVYSAFNAVVLAFLKAAPTSAKYASIFEKVFTEYSVPALSPLISFISSKKSVACTIAVNSDSDPANLKWEVSPETCKVCKVTIDSVGQVPLGKETLESMIGAQSILNDSSISNKIVGGDINSLVTKINSLKGECTEIFVGVPTPTSTTNPIAIAPAPRPAPASENQCDKLGATRCSGDKQVQECREEIIDLKDGQRSRIWVDTFSCVDSAICRAFTPKGQSEVTAECRFASTDDCYNNHLAVWTSKCFEKFSERKLDNDILQKTNISSSVEAMLSISSTDMTGHIVSCHLELSGVSKSGLQMSSLRYYIQKQCDSGIGEQCVNSKTSFGPGLATCESRK